jgi:hypothetical protein
VIYTKFLSAEILHLKTCKEEFDILLSL